MEGKGREGRGAVVGGMVDERRDGGREVWCIHTQGRHLKRASRLQHATRHSLLAVI